MAKEFGNYLDMSNTGGMPFEADDLEWHFDGINHVIVETLRRFGDNYIVQGCEESAGNVSAGYVMLDGELLRVNAHTRGANTHYVKQAVTYDGNGLETFLDTNPYNTYAELRAEVTGTSGNLRYDGYRFGSIFTVGLQPQTVVTAAADFTTSALYWHVGFDGMLHLWGDLQYTGAATLSSGVKQIGTLLAGSSGTDSMPSVFWMGGILAGSRKVYMGRIHVSGTIIQLFIDLDNSPDTLAQNTDIKVHYSGLNVYIP